MRLITMLMLFCSMSADAAILDLFKAKGRINVRAPNEVTTNLSAAQLNAVIGDINGARASGTFNALLGKDYKPVPLDRSYAATDIASAVAGAIFNKTAFGLAATLALPYAIDALTGTVTKTVQNPPTSSTYNPSQIGNISCAYGMNVSESNKPFSRFQELTTQHPESGTIQPGYNSQQVHYRASWGGILCLFSTPVPIAPDYCTSPSVYDPALSMCTGTIFNEPANMQQLESDIAQTFGQNPPAIATALTGLLDNDIEPQNGQTSLGNEMPEPIQAETTTTTKNYFDPSTGHPVTEETTTEKKYTFEKKSPTDLEIKPQSISTTTITDNVTNNTTTNISTTTTTPSAAHDTESQTDAGQTDCDKYPDAIGCSEYGEITAEPASTVTPVPFIFPDDGEAENQNYQCPTPMEINTNLLGQLHFSYEPLCGFADSIRPFFVIFAWLTAGFMCFGVVRS